MKQVLELLVQKNEAQREDETGYEISNHKLSHESFTVHQMK